MSTSVPYSVSPKAAKATLNVVLTGIQAKTSRKSVERYMVAHPNVKINVITVDETLTAYLQILENKNIQVDVCEIDLVWIGALAKYLVDLNQYSGKELAKAHFPALIEGGCISDNLVAMPSFADVGLLYYRTDLLEKYRIKLPNTWDELQAAAKVIQTGERAAGNKDFWGYVWQGNSYEGLTCNALEWICSSGGGTIVDRNGQITINNHAVIEMIDRAASWVGDISPYAIMENSGFAEEISRNLWQHGNAAFMRNWSYAYALGNEGGSVIRNKFSVSLLPKGDGGESVSTLGGFYMAATKRSNHPEIAADFVFFITSAKEQKSRIKESFLPTIMNLYEDQEILQSYPFMADFYSAFMHPVIRPASIVGDKYDAVSTNFFRAVHSVLAREKSAKIAISQLEKILTGLLRGDFLS